MSQQDEPKYILRFSDASMRERLKDEAKRRNRSLNKQILFVLERYLDDEGLRSLVEAHSEDGDAA